MLSYILESIFTNLEKCFCHNIRLKKNSIPSIVESLKPVRQIKIQHQQKQEKMTTMSTWPASEQCERQHVFPPSLRVFCGGAQSSVWRMSSGSGGLHCPIACGILVSTPGITPTSLALEGRFLTTEPAGKSFHSCILNYRVYIILS